MIGRPPRPPLFPYTPLFRSKSEEREPELREAQAGAVHSREGSVDVAKLGRNEQDGEPPFLRERRGRRSNGGHGVNDRRDRKSTRLNSSHGYISYAVFCLKKK